MVREIHNILKNYKDTRANNDRVYAHEDEHEKETLSVALIEKNRPQKTRRRLTEKNTLREATLAAVEHELKKVQNWVDYMLTSVNVAALNEVKALEGVELTPYQVQMFMRKYNGDFYTTAAFCASQNKKRDAVNQLTYTQPEKFLQEAQRLKEDVVFILQNFSGDPITSADAGQMAANVKMQLIESKWDQNFDAFSCEYFNESDFDRPTPLNSSQKQTVEGIFAGCNSIYDKAMAAETAAEKGFADLILRSEYSRFLKDYKEKLEVSEQGKQMLYGGYTGANEETSTAAESMELSEIAGESAPEETTPQDNAE